MKSFSWEMFKEIVDQGETDCAWKAISDGYWLIYQSGPFEVECLITDEAEVAEFEADYKV